MALPAGAATATITAGGSTDVAGDPGTISALTVAPEQRLVWAATGAAIETVAAVAYGLAVLAVITSSITRIMAIPQVSDLLTRAGIGPTPNTDAK